MTTHSARDYFRNLKQRVMASSQSTVWESAVLEWEMLDWEEDESLESSCVCGKDGLRWLFTLVNKCNGNRLYPVGSCCVKRFGRRNLSEDAGVRERLFRLLHAIEDNECITLTADLFSRKLLAYLLREGAFPANEHNRFDPENSCRFLLDMFNKRDKNSISAAQDRKIKALIMNAVRPWLRRQLAAKIRRREET